MSKHMADEKLFLPDTHNSFTPLRCEHAALSLSCIPEATSSSRSEADQRKFELMCSRQKQSQSLHESGGHRNARDTYRDLEAAGMQVHQLRRYILGHQCKCCQSNLGRKAYHCQKARQIVSQPEFVVTPTHTKRPDPTLRETPELELAREFVRLSFPVTLPASYSPPDLPTPKGKMIVVAVRAQKQSSGKALVWVKFLSPPSHVGKQIQFYPKSLEPKNGPAKGQDFSLLSALELSHPGARTWKELGVNTISTSTATAGMLAALQAYNGGTRSSTEEVSTTGSETSEPNPVLLQELSDESHSPQAPEGYTRGLQDPKHRNQMLRSPLKPSWLVAEKSEMDGLYRRKCWVKVLRSSLTPQDEFFSTRFHYKIKRKDGQFDKCKVRLVIQ
jgi:hypothetical protein